MDYEEFKPPASLKELIICFWALQHDYHDAGHSYEELWADTHIELILCEGESYFMKSGHISRELPKSIIIGPCKKNLTLHSNGLTSFVAVRFYPWSINLFFQKEISQLINNVVPAADILGSEQIAQLQNALKGATRAEQVQILMDYFKDKQAKLQHHGAFSQSIGQEIIKKNGMVELERLTSSFNISPRQLQRIFKQETGMSLKMFARITRFNYAKRLIEDDPFVSLAQLAAETGYADQAHFTKNFKELFNITPAVYKTRWKHLHKEYADQ